MSAILALLLLLGPQENDAKRAREATLGLPGLAKSQEIKEPPPPQSFTGGREKRSADDFKDLFDHNVFSPPRKKEATKTGDAAKPPEGPKSRTFVLTGIVYNGAEKRYEALIEDKTAKEAKFYKEGDAVAGGTLSEITLEQVTLVRGAAPTVLKVNDTVTQEGVSSPPPAPKAEESADVEEARKRLKNKHRRESVPDEAEDEAGGKKKPK